MTKHVSKRLHQQPSFTRYTEQIWYVATAASVNKGSYVSKDLNACRTMILRNHDSSGNHFYALINAV